MKSILFFILGFISCVILLFIFSDTNKPEQSIVYKTDLPDKAEIQHLINEIIVSHGKEPIEEDGVIGIETLKAWDDAIVLQMGDNITREYME